MHKSGACTANVGTVDPACRGGACIMDVSRAAFPHEPQVIFYIFALQHHGQNIEGNHPLLHTMTHRHTLSSASAHDLPLPPKILGFRLRFSISAYVSRLSLAILQLRIRASTSAYDNLSAQPILHFRKPLSTPASAPPLRMSSVTSA